MVIELQLMKTIAFLLISTVCILAQDSFSQSTPTPAMSAQQAKAKVASLGGHIFRRVDGKIYNFFQSGIHVYGWVQYVDADVVIVQEGNKYQAIKNYNGLPATDGRQITAFAIRNGVFIWNTKPLELWDCGTLLTPAEEKQQQAEFESAQIKYQQERIAATKLKAFIANSNEVVRLSLEATNGSAAAQYSLALHYLDGHGCETNKDLAVHWLKIASDGGYFGASNKLAELNH
jgi:TPR repeat protein